MSQEPATTLEDDLRATLRRAAGHAPLAPPGLLAGVGRRSRRRARIRLLASAAAVAVVTAGTVFAVRYEKPEPVVVNPSLPAITREQVVGSPAVEEVWPHAVRVVPATLKGVGRLRALALVDDRTTLLSTWGSHENANAVYAYDQVTRETRKVTDVPTRRGEISDGFLVVGDRLIWHVSTDTGAVMWEAPLSGGTARRLPGRLPHVPARMEVRGDRFVYSAQEGVFSVPLTGGRPEPVPGGQGLFLLEWPWAGAFEPSDMAEIAFRRLVNLETGEVSEVTPDPGDRTVICGVTTCSGLHADGTPFVRGRDGTGERRLPGVSFGLAADRIMGLDDSRSGESEQYLVDVATGRAGSLELDMPLNAEGAYTTIAVTVDRRDMLSAHRTGARTLVIIDLRRIVSGR
ncbi:hypothetical protein [Herbidospora daliensis]|uniref:hypothetical protein n=1 Tax=Herbidospora daliensis TaxID=295585 RepID=UPI0007813CD0|nr:hypothetical protein [Herbidospora daliensis]